ncbi:MAG: 2-amino-4-hydroxy-6-hydroxymethyldihydropteridine diphosphokinase [Rhodothermales bacterium]
MMPVAAYIGLGANLGNRMAALQAAVDALAGLGDVKAVSPVYASEAHTLHPAEHAPDFLNAAVHLETTWLPEALLAELHAIEASLGRQRPSRWAPRTLDLDLLLYGDQSLDTETLTLPHPRLHLRRFVLQPLSDLAPALVVSSPFGATVTDLLAQCPDTHALHRHSKALRLPHATA